MSNIKSVLVFGLGGLVFHSKTFCHHCHRQTLPDDLVVRPAVEWISMMINKSKIHCRFLSANLFQESLSQVILGIQGLGVVKMRLSVSQ
jgi:hypothetical protein